MFYNTGISTYVWILTNDKAEADRGTVKLVDARDLGTKMRKSLGDKRKELTPSAIDQIAQLYGGARDESADDPRVKVLHPGDVRLPAHHRRAPHAPPLGGHALRPSPTPALRRVCRPGRVVRFNTEKALLAEVPGLTTAQKKAFARACAVADAEAPIVKGRGGKVEPDPDLRDQENIPLPDGWLDLDDDEREKALVEAAEAHLDEEIRPYVPDAWIDHAKTKLGFEIPFTRQFYVYTPPRPVDEIAAEIKELEAQIQTWMKGSGCDNWSQLAVRAPAGVGLGETHTGRAVRNGSYPRPHSA